MPDHANPVLDIGSGAGKHALRFGAARCESPERL
jgi:hypothetical protein